VFRAEDEAVPTIRERVSSGSAVYADEAPGWDALHARFDARRINHSIAFSDNGACTNQAESYLARLRRPNGRCTTSRLARRSAIRCHACGGATGSAPQGLRAGSSIMRCDTLPKSRAGNGRS
jgi:hypothetical protein